MSKIGKLFQAPNEALGVHSSVAPYKDSHNSDLISASTLRQRRVILRELLENGLRVTAQGINVMLGFNDGRKYISDIRKLNNYPYAVQSIRLDDGRKVYRLEKIILNPQLFNAAEGVKYE